MNAVIAQILSKRLEPLHSKQLVTTLSGLVKTASVVRDGGRVIKFPVPHDTETQNIIIENASLVPDYGQRAILYFEGLNSTISESVKNKTKMRSNLRLVCWYNAARFLKSGSGTIHEMLLSEILRLLQTGRDTNVVQGIVVSPTTVLDSTATLFSRYSYLEERGQYLLAPYFALGVDINVTYQLSHNCCHGELLPVDVDCC